MAMQGGGKRAKPILLLRNPEDSAKRDIAGRRAKCDILPRQATPMKPGWAMRCPFVRARASQVMKRI